MIVSSVKTERVFYRSFDPVETPRFSTSKIIGEATSSLGSIIPLLAPHIDDATRHNLRASFLAGLVSGLGQPLLLTQLGDNPIPTDYREEVLVVKTPDDIRAKISTFSVEALRSIQHARRPIRSNSSGPLIKTLWLGASAAENEFRTLEQYFLETSEFIQTLNGVAKVIVGRKGSGKTAIFFMVRDAIRRRKGSTVIDLKPESHELVKLRELLSQYVTAGVLSHTFSGFWFVLLLIEILLTMRKDLFARIRIDANALTSVRAIEDVLERFSIPAEGDFTSRLNAFVHNVIQDVQQETKAGGRLPPEKLTNFVYGHEQRALRELIVRFAPKGGTISVLFDNLDRGWPATGVRAEDVQFLRSLIESLNRIQRELSDQHVEFQFSVFLRNDVYELLVAETTDRGKEAATLIDWSDREKLRLVVVRRIAASTNSDNALTQWRQHFPETVEGRDGLEYAIDHSLMRPRFLIDIIERSISFAINRAHEKVTAIDLVDAVRQHSNYLVSDFGYEIRDASELPYEIIDTFLGSEQRLGAQAVRNLLALALDKPEAVERAEFLLVWYGFFGVHTASGTGQVKYIYDYDYSMRRMEAEIKRAGADLFYVINPAFYVGLA